MRQLGDQGTFQVNSIEFGYHIYEKAFDWEALASEQARSVQMKSESQTPRVLRRVEEDFGEILLRVPT